jgi:hypothetical protein
MRSTLVCSAHRNLNLVMTTAAKLDFVAEQSAARIAAGVARNMCAGRAILKFVIFNKFASA